MTIHTFHLVRTSAATTLKAMTRPPDAASVPGLAHGECMTTMKLGSLLVSPDRLQLGRLAMFARWSDDDAIDRFLGSDGLGQTFADGWHVRLEFLRRWGQVEALGQFPPNVNGTDPEQPVVAVTLARMKFPQVPRFIRWGVPVEKLVRDHPGTTLALAAAHPLRTVSTFSVWKTQREMTEMVHGHTAMEKADRHAAAMAERRRKDFHFEFTTLRFRALSEHGEWDGRTNICALGL